jgi:hypothetical protein
MRNMSFALTTEQYKAGTKTETRRLGWANLKPGDRFMAVEKGMGLKRGEHPVKLGPGEVVTNEPERLDAITQEAVVREGFPEMTPAEFVAMFCRHMRVEPSQIVNVIRFRHLD